VRARSATRLIAGSQAETIPATFAGGGISAIPEASRCSGLFPRDDVPLMHRGLNLSWTTSGAIDSFSLLAAAHPFGSRPQTAATVVPPSPPDVAANSITSCHGSRHDTHENSREAPGDRNWLGLGRRRCRYPRQAVTRSTVIPKHKQTRPKRMEITILQSTQRRREGRM